MSNKIIPFQFHTHTVRTIYDHGELLFVARDVAAILGYASPSVAVSKHCKGVSKMEIPTNGGVQLMVVIPERDVYRLVMNSKLPEAEKFEEWVVSEVLPSIRKTGSYSVEQKQDIPQLSNPLKDRVDAIQSMGDWIIKTVVGIKPELAVTATLTTITKETGISTDAFRLALPSVDPQSIGKLNATTVGKYFDLNAQSVNKLLESLGFQNKRTNGGWELTEKGLPYGETKPFTKNGHSDYQILWKESIIDELRKAA
jgi:prophage antirepressor-like protein